MTADPISSDLPRPPGTIYFGHENYHRNTTTENDVLDSILHPIPYSITEVRNKIKPHPLDRRYPHFCFECKKPLKFEELFDANITYYNSPNAIWRRSKLNFDMPLYRKLKKLWRSQVIEFYCCNCYRKKDMPNLSFSPSGRDQGYFFHI